MACLIWSCEEDSTVDWFVGRYLNHSEIAWFRFDVERFPEMITVDLGVNHCKIHFSSSKTISADEINFVWYRKPRPSEFRVLRPTPESISYIRDEAAWALTMVHKKLSHAIWMNLPDLNLRAGDKIRQLEIAEQVGFRCPKTIVTNDASSAIDFATDYGGQLVVKPVHKGSLGLKFVKKVFYTTILSAEQIQSRAVAISICPLIFQEPIPKLFELRVVVVGDDCHAVRLDSQERSETIVDWRRSPGLVRHSIFSLPEWVSDKCVRLVRQEGLLFSAFDFIVTPEGEYVFLEHNPNGQFAWLEEFTGIPIGQSLMKLFENYDIRMRGV
ncbi:MAG: hypothetical protein A2418_01520 [Candidatus Brennerbacteria bacterium RIFOXYC1_FULL_41_11]|nr:MAG: hypothetical protein A2391_00505 [Candidatus Brennerbacteria bacterium RIFOXYB1_FULL_41_13]OGY39329.1 MAG: hypothetical protein A2418_01520 [Candidatus Brennerbacteria bacterium RIFOXYC1_FULL_41_11]